MHFVLTLCAPQIDRPTHTAAVVSANYERNALTLRQQLPLKAQCIGTGIILPQLPAARAQLQELLSKVFVTYISLEPQHQVCFSASVPAI
jgi:hypothetical protein